MASFLSLFSPVSPNNKEIRSRVVNTLRHFVADATVRPVTKEAAIKLKSSQVGLGALRHAARAYTPPDQKTLGLAEL